MVARSSSFCFQASTISDMPTVRFPAVMKYYVNNQAEFSISATTIQDLIEQIVQEYPTVKFHLLGSDGQLRRHFNIFVNGILFRDLKGMTKTYKHAHHVTFPQSG